MGDGFRIFDVTDPPHPKPAGGYLDAGWENDVQVRGDIGVLTYDAAPERGMARDLRLLLGWALDVIDLRGVNSGNAVHRYRLIDESRATTDRCPAGATFTCIVMKRPDGSSARGLWRPHDVFFSKDGRTAYVAALNSTFIVDVGSVLSGRVKTITVIPNEHGPNGLANPDNIELSHQADVTSDGKILIVNDERGGGLDNTDCNTDPNGVIGALHFWALGSIKGVALSQGASPATPKKLGIYVNPRPTLGPDPLQPAINLLPRPERGCTSHVFRVGGNGTSSPGPIAEGLDGVSGLPARELVVSRAIGSLLRWKC